MCGVPHKCGAGGHGGVGSCGVRHREIYGVKGICGVRDQWGGGSVGWGVKGVKGICGVCGIYGAGCVYGVRNSYGVEQLWGERSVG